jgi:hypothetical protein
MHYPYGVAVDASGSVYVADTINSRILKESLVGGAYTQSVLIPGPPASGIVLDGQGNIYFPDPDDATVFKISYNTPPSLSFADSNLGAQSSDSPETFSVINTGNTALSIQVPSSGTNPNITAGYSLDAATTCPQLGTGSSAGSVPAGSTCTYAVDFIPQAVGLDAGSLILSDNTLNIPSSTQTISLTGTGNTIATTTADSSTTTGFSPNIQSVTLSASVTSGNGTVNAGTVTFTVLRASTVVGSATTSSAVTSGVAGVSYSLPAGTAAGVYTIGAVYNAGGSFATSSDTAHTLTVNKAAQTIHFTAPATPITYSAGMVIPLSATGGASGNTITFILDASSTGTGTIGNNSLTVTGAGTLVIDANQAGNGNYSAATQAQVTVVVNKTAQTIHFTAPASPVTYTPGLVIPLSAIGGGSGDAIVFSLDAGSTGTGTIAGNSLTATSAGTLVIDANQTGNGDYSSATQAQVTVVVNKAAQTIHFTAPVSPVTYGVSPITLVATGGSSGNTVTFSVAGPADVSGSTLTISGAGTVAITANQTGNVNYAAATAVEQTILVKQATSATSLSSSVNPLFETDSTIFTAKVTSSAGAPTGNVSFLDGTTLLGDGTLSDGAATLTISSLAVGAHKITAAYSGDANFAASTSGGLSQSVIGFSLSPASGSDASQTVAPGGSATYKLVIAPTAGATLPVATVLTVTGLPPGASASLAAAGWTQSGSTSWSLPAFAALSDVSLTIKAPSQTASVDQDKPRLRTLPPLLWGVLLLPFAGKVRRAGKRMGRTVSLLLLLAAGTAAITALSGCGSGNGFFANQQKTYIVTVTVTAGTLSLSTNLSLTVQ